MTNSEDTAPQVTVYPYSWAPDCGVTLDDFLKKVRTRYFPTLLTIGAQWSGAETLNGRGRWNKTGEHNNSIVGAAAQRSPSVQWIWVKGSDPSRENTNMDAALEEATDLCTFIHSCGASFRSMVLLSKRGHCQN